MPNNPKTASFKAKLFRPVDPGADKSWAFLILPKAASDQLPRRGRTTVNGTMNGAVFQETLEPDGQLSHWLKVNAELMESAGAAVGDIVNVEISPVKQEPNPAVPQDLENALKANSEAQAAWAGITTVARLDWIHWIVSAKKDKTRSKRISDACEMLTSDKQRVCCFDSSGFYSKAFRSPEAAE